MRLFLRAGIVLGLAAAAACGKDAPSPVDFNDPAAVSANLSSVDSAFDSDVFRSFNVVAAFYLDAAAPQPAIQQATTLIQTLRPKLERTGGQVFLPGLLQARKLQAIIPNLSVSAAQGRIIPDSMYGRVFEWDTAANAYSFQGTTVSNLNGVRFVLYAVGLAGEVVEPVSAIGRLDIVDQSTPTLLQLQVLVENSGGTTTYVDYNAAVQSSSSAVNAFVSGSISNGLSGGSNKTLTFDQQLNVNLNTGSAGIHATFALNDPAITVMLNESVAFEDPNIVVNADFRIIEGGETIRTVGRITISTLSQELTVNITVYVDGHPVASIRGDPTDPATQWVDAGGEPLSVADLAALDALFDALEVFDSIIGGFFAPISTFAGL